MKSITNEDTTPSTTTLSLSNLPFVVLCEILDYLTLSEQYRLSGQCQQLRASQKEYNSQQTSLDLDVSSSTTIPFHLGNLLTYFVQLQDLNLGRHATHAHLNLLGHDDPVVLPSLVKLSMARSKHIDNHSLLRLSESRLMATLQEIDITYCPETTYQGTFCLRDKCTNLKVLRRQPKWMDGKFCTPFSNTSQVEVHTYWPDGSFQFSRSGQSCGFVCRIQELSVDSNDEHNDGRFVCDKLQYNNLQLPPGWPDSARNYYRPGVTLLQLDDEIINGQLVQSVLVAQKMKGLRPPTRIRPLMERVQSTMALGESRHYSSSGSLVPADQVGEQRNLDNLTLISRMRLISFDPAHDSLLPPAELVTQNRDFCEHLRNNPFTDEFEDILHLRLGGDPEEVRPRGRRRVYVPRH